MATVTRERELLRELVALVRGECPSLLNEDSGGDVRLSMAIDDALASPPAEAHEMEVSRHELRDDRSPNVGAFLLHCLRQLRRIHPQPDGEGGNLLMRWRQAPPASDPPRLGCESPSNCDPKLDLCTHCQARTAPNGLTPPSWITARQSDPPGLVANWRPIETAPKRTDVLAGWADRPHWLPQVLQQDDAGMWFNGEESDYRPPTHWMPLPASPQAETKGDE